MDKRIAIIGIIIDNIESSAQVNEVLHDYNEYIVGRMGIPYREKGISVISVVVDAPNNAINSIAGRLGRLDGVSAKAVYQKNA